MLMGTSLGKMGGTNDGRFEKKNGSLSLVSEWVGSWKEYVMKGG